MKSLLAVAIVLVLLLPRGTFAQDAKPGVPYLINVDAKPAAEVSLNEETEKLKVQMQLFLQENASLRKQLAQANAQLAELNEKEITSGGSQLLKQLAEKHGLRAEDYDFSIDPKTGEMKFVRKAEKK